MPTQQSENPRQFFEIKLKVEKYEGDNFEDPDRPPFVQSNNYLHFARELVYEGDYGTADYVLRSLYTAQGNVGLALKIRFEEDHGRDNPLLKEQVQRLQQSQRVPGPKPLVVQTSNKAGALFANEKSQIKK